MSREVHQTLWERISEVADFMRDTPQWQRGSPVNERVRCDPLKPDQAECSLNSSYSIE
jgi:hypothetical protein